LAIVPFQPHQLRNIQFDSTLTLTRTDALYNDKLDEIFNTLNELKETFQNSNQKKPRRKILRPQGGIYELTDDSNQPHLNQKRILRLENQIKKTQNQLREITANRFALQAELESFRSQYQKRFFGFIYSKQSFSSN